MRLLGHSHFTLSIVAIFGYTSNISPKVGTVLSFSITAYYIIIGNCVGYGTFDKENNQKIIFGIQFNGIGSETGLLFKDLKGDFVDGDNIQMSYCENGKTKLMDYYYLTMDDSYVDEDGWYNKDTDFIGDTEYIPWGKGAWFVAYDEAKSLTMSGEVKKGHKIHTFTDPKTLVTSFYPTPFCPNSANVTWSNQTDSDNIQVQGNKDGKTILIDYYYLTMDDSYVDEDGWYDKDTELLGPNDSIVGVGEGFWFIPVNVETSFTEVSPLGDEEAK